MIKQLWGPAQAGGYDMFLAAGERLGMAQHRRDLLARARGRVLEVGAGTGLNIPHYPADLAELVLTEPDPAMVGRLRARAARSSLPTAAGEAAAEHLPFDDGTFDTVVSTMVLCTVDDPRCAAAEIRRVLRPGGQLLFIEHVRATGGPRAFLQDLLERVWARVALGCHCNRVTTEVLQTAGLRLTDLRTDVWRGMPAVVRPLVIGHAQV